MNEILLKLAHWWNGVWYVPKHSHRADWCKNADLPEITFP